jgi:hypothetical protein
MDKSVVCVLSAEDALSTRSSLHLQNGISITSFNYNCFKINVHPSANTVGLYNLMATLHSHFCMEVAGIMPL